MTSLLSICIPTYNGGEHFKYNVNKLIDMSLKYNFYICVSDNASTDETQEYMLNLITKYDFIKYHRNKNNQGWAYNFDYVLKMADTEYAWLLGDDDEIFEDTIEKVMKALLTYEPDICILNSLKDTNIKSKLYTDKNEVLSDLGLALTFISNCIFKNTVIKKINLKQVKNNAFPHTIEILNYLKINCKLFCLDNVNIKPLKNIAEMRYSDKHMEYFFCDYRDIVINLIGYNDIAKKMFIKKRNELFTLKNIINMRRAHAITLKKLYDFRNNYNKIPLKLIIIFFLVSLEPKLFWDVVYKTYKLIKILRSKFL